MTEHVIVTDADGIRTIRMNRPDKKNALTLAMYETMTAALEGANADDSVRCVLIAGVPGAFSAGNDLADFLTAAESSDGSNRPALRFLPALVRCNKPMIAAVSGVAVGVGTTMLFHCDFVVAGSDARFSTPFVSLGLIPEAQAQPLLRAASPFSFYRLSAVRLHATGAAQERRSVASGCLSAPSGCLSAPSGR
jgi:enoyl-CoA hydratase/carnithine racemase